MIYQCKELKRTKGSGGKKLHCINILLWFLQKFQVVENQGDRELYTYKTLQMFYSFNSKMSSMQHCTNYYKQINHFPYIWLMAHLCGFLNVYGLKLACQQKAMALLKYTNVAIIYLCVVTTCLAPFSVFNKCHLTWSLSF